MKIKNTRKPENSEKNEIIPHLIMFGATVCILTAVLYALDFGFYDVGESLYILNSKFPNKEVSIHNTVIKFFELLYGRDYMTSKLEGLPVSAILSTMATAAIHTGINLYEDITGKKLM